MRDGEGADQARFLKVHSRVPKEQRRGRVPDGALASNQMGCRLDGDAGVEAGFHQAQGLRADNRAQLSCRLE